MGAARSQGHGSSAASQDAATAAERVRDLEERLQRERKRVSTVETSLRNQQEMFQYAGAFGMAAVALAGGACSVLMRRHAASAMEAAKRNLALTDQLADLRRRSALDLKKAEKFSVHSLATDLLPVADNLEHARKHALQGSDVGKGKASGPGGTSLEEFWLPDSASDRLSALTEGVTLTEKSLLHAFSKHGIEKQSPISQPFDPNMHEAMMRVHDPSVKPGVVTEVLRSGFVIHERVLRAAQVAVSFNPDGGDRNGEVEDSTGAPTDNAKTAEGAAGESTDGSQGRS